MAIVISGYYGFDNAGDEAILYSIIHALKDESPAISITVLSNQPEKTSQLYNVSAVNRWSLKEVIRAIKASDGVISGGGSLLQDYTSFKSISYYCGVMGIARFFNKPYFIYAQGIGPIKSKINQRLVAFTVNHASLVTVRDQESKHLLQSISVKENIMVVPDPVMGLKITAERVEPLRTYLPEGPYISVAVRYWSKKRTYLKELSKALTTLAEQAVNMVLVPMHGVDDLKCSEDIKAMMSKQAQQHTFIVPAHFSIQEKAKIIAHSELLIGMRLHSLIFAANSLTPFIAISYDPKIDAFTKLCGQPLMGHVQSLNWDAKQLITEINSCLTSKENLVEKIQKYANTASKRANLTANTVLSRLGASAYPEKTKFNIDV
ncbi:polysaccharide pyruvyl transferase CsaB [Anaerobacillus alkalilacustris]|uniref:Polysaccharide pyruvyl transferase CsaB n=1 Tax=Anaerobacillus alkalilacustris TaxID=393763 RepID=A0A1S2LKY0_9BACI|nr:polysaccharide pyruvyl transferase CsaB [Anaerobacillus alkalilacustris]OIJ13046.1 polysaccharide pyruvyl transferase CsaB [Anaerobacillus alkalilacustris]